MLAPSWSPPHDCAFLLASRLWPGPLFHLLSNFHDVAAFGRLAANSVPVPLLASSWVHPGVFTPDLRATKVYDIVVLANFSKYKRHFSLFKMLRHMPASTSVLLLGKGWQGRDETTLRCEASWYGVEDRITVRVGLPDDEMISAMRSAKVGFIPSLNEGSCVAVMELLFCDIPVALFDEAIIGSKVFLNPCTGMLLQRRHAAAQMTTFLARQKEYTPRAWINEHNLSCFGSTEILNATLRDKCEALGEPWTQDIVPHHWRPNPSYVEREAALQMADIYASFRRRYRVDIAVPGNPDSSMERDLAASGRSTAENQHPGGDCCVDSKVSQS